jgi:hypothetical protein
MVLVGNAESIGIALASCRKYESERQNSAFEKLKARF